MAPQAQMVLLSGTWPRALGNVASGEEVGEEVLFSIKPPEGYSEEHRFLLPSKRARNKEESTVHNTCAPMAEGKTHQREFSGNPKSPPDRWNE